MIAIEKERTYLVMEHWRENPGQGNVVRCACEPTRLIVACHHASFDFWEELILGRVSENVCAARESKLPLEHVSYRPFCWRGARSSLEMGKNAGFGKKGFNS
jgi:hypothetical protein